MSGSGGNERINFVDDSQQWADLATELETPDPILDAPDPDVKTPDTPTPPPERRPDPPTIRTETETEPELPLDEPPAPDAPPKPKPTYEELERNYQNTTRGLKEARDARRRAEETLNHNMRLVEELRQARTPPPPQPKELPPLPDVNEDPIAHFQARTERLEAELHQARQATEQVNQHRQAQEHEARFWNHVKAAEDAYRPTTPTVEVDGKKFSDYDLACEHLRHHRMQELTNLYPDDSAIALAEAQQYGLPTPGHLRAAILHQDAIGIAQRAYQLGVSPAQLYYAAAKGRGYVSPNGSVTTAKKPNGVIEAAKRGKRASLTISGGDSRKSENDLSQEDLAELAIDDPEEFDRQWDRMAKAGRLG